MLKNDRWIKQQASAGMIEPFTPELVRRIELRHPYSFDPILDKVVWEIDTVPALSYGCSSYGYDLRLSPKEFLIFRHVPGTVMDPKRFNPDNLEPADLHSDSDGAYFILPAHSYGLGVAREKLKVPANVTVICLGKSTYARLGIILNATPAEAGWEGNLTLEFSNSSGADCRIYANEGVCQLLFFEGDPCDVTYEDRDGKYQHQPERVVPARV
jgi:dCTP deaminase